MVGGGGGGGGGGSPTPVLPAFQRGKSSGRDNLLTVFSPACPADLAVSQTPTRLNILREKENGGGGVGGEGEKGVDY